ncbi:SsrA-binding protein SmpB [Proteiniclasticum sp. BAD-10]|uniref:SsrA-binding protein n=1 Tax=Proteiniclasticum sediminis TaxID=2804028 RepID=A0A941CTH3_9CLOT|nr:SsrA-binding protein SmpB [Proteiniclasticum sediminis]MBR0577101.1 SsrA-binding protein SmpB [Proteiniclasticum sediminis]
MDKKERKNRTLAENRKARHDYFIEEVYEAGIELIGTEVKSIRMGKANLKESYAEIKNGEIFISGMHISPYEMGNIYNRDPLRRRKLLMHKNEILKLDQLSAADGYTLIPLSLYLKNGRVKIAIAVAKGKKNYDKRDSMLEKAHKRDMDREFKERNR